MKLESTPSIYNSIYLAFLFVIIFGCNSESPSNSDIEITVLESYDTLVDLESNTVALPIIIKAGVNSSFFVYDIGVNQIFKLDENGNIIKSIGRIGRGPGEYLFINNIFLTEEFLYIIDTAQFLITQYDKEGNVVSTFDYGDIGGKPSTPPPVFGGVVKPNENDNQPYVTSQGDILLSNLNIGAESQHIFKLIDWEKKKQLTKLGEVPDGSSFILDNLKLRNEASQKEIPSFYKANSFPVQDRVNPKEFFIVYSSISKIAKYTLAGEKLWEKNITTQETEGIRKLFFETMDRLSKSPDVRDRVDIEFYSSGFSSDEGDLFLVVNYKPVIIYQFNNDGELVNKYQFNSKNVTPVLDIDFKNKQIFTVTVEGEIRSYPF